MVNPVLVTLAVRLTVNPFNIYTTSLFAGTALPVKVAPEASVVQVPAVDHAPLLPLVYSGFK